MLAKKFHLPIQDRMPKGKRKTGSLKNTKYFSIRTIANNLFFSRLGIVVSQKVSKKAVERNQIKRTIFNFVRLNSLHRQPGKDILIIVLPAVNNLTKTEIEKELSIVL